MRGDIIFQVFGVHQGREKDVFFGAFRTGGEAQAEIEQLSQRTMHGENWAARYHNRGFAIREKTVATDFNIPPLPKPRDKYFVRTTAKPNRPGTWDSTRVEVFRRALSENAEERICEYERNYAMLLTFEPFRQGNREFALIAPRYTRTTVLDLASGDIVAEEGRPGSSADGFCPVGFFVPDWWDLHGGTKIPGSEDWTERDERPTGDFGFVWGCHWGDDSSWKVQYLDLSRLAEGVITRDDRFGYVELATDGYTTPCLKPGPEAAEQSKPPKFIRLSTYDDRVTFEVEMEFELNSGRPIDWKRMRVENFE